MRPTPSALALLFALALLAPGEARANCALPVTYRAVVSGNSVTVVPQNFDSRGCPDPGGMLRQDVASGATVRLADFCAPSPPSQPAGYLDECVPPGRYRYGYGLAYACVPSACSTDRFVEAVVSATLPAGCLPGAGNPGPTAVGPVGWTAGQAAVCTYGAHMGSMGCGGCGSLPAGSGAVLLADLALLAGGLLWMRRRRAAGRR